MLKASLLCLAPLLSIEAPESPDWVGCWRSVGASKHVLLLEEERAGWLEGDHEPRFYRLRAGEGRLLLERWSSLSELSFSWGETGGLKLVGDGLDAEFERCGVPAELMVKPYDWPVGSELDDATVAVLGADLAERRAEDQRVRQFQGQPTPAQIADMQAVDAGNTEFLLEVVGELGWIGAERFTPAAADAAFLIVQHAADLRLMRSALPHIEADVRAGRLDGQNFALLHDRLQLNLGYRQRYGSQIGRSAQFGSVLMPCEDLEHVDERRAELGMGPLKEYLEYFREEPEGALPGHLPDLMPQR